ncbi:MAG: CBS and ACT domain-containing protein [Thermodesulfobacteriota bacterium]
MLIRDWMAKNVLTVDENTSLMRATRIMKENSIRRLPVVSHGKLVGIITDRDVKDASPSKTTSLDVHELYYLLSEMKVKDLMTPNPIVIGGHESLEKAAVIMLECKISGVPVIDESGYLIGLLSETDVLRGFIHSTGIKDGAMQYVFDLVDEPGSVTRVVKILREHNARVISVLTSFEDAPEGKKRVAIRVVTTSPDEAEKLSDLLSQNFTVVFQGRDELKDLPKRRK